MLESFHSSLKEIGVTYNEETGRLSEPITFVVYKNRTHIPAERVFVVGQQFIIFEEDAIRRIKAENVMGINLIKEGRFGK